MWWSFVTAWALPPLEDLAAPHDEDPREEALPGELPGAGFPGLPAPIVNGTETADFESVVALAGIDDAGNVEVFCSGSLIQKRWVITAAHCILGAPAYQSSGFDLFVLFGSDIRNDSYLQAFPWTTSEVHPDYDAAGFTGDIGLVQFDGPKLGTRLMVLGDAAPDDTWLDVDLTFVGFGITGDGADDTGTKRFTAFPLSSFDDSNLLAGDPDLDTNVCQGDSGGATLQVTPAGFELVGINAFVTPGCIRGTAGSTRVDAHLAWVLELVPDALTEPPEPRVATGLDLGVDDPEAVGLAGMPTPAGGGFAPGCSATHRVASGSWLVAAAAALGVTRRRPRRQRAPAGSATASR